MIAAGGVVTSTKDLTKNLLNTAAGIPGSRMTPEQYAAHIAKGGPGVVTLATPGQTPRSAVTQQAVNTPTTTPAAVASPAPTEQTPATQTAMELLTSQLAEMIRLLTLGVSAEDAQVALMRAIAESRGGRVQFPDNEWMADSIRLQGHHPIA